METSGILTDINWRIDSEEPPIGYENILSQEINWETDDEGNVILVFLQGYDKGSKYLRFDHVKYKLEHIKNGYQTLGAIYTYYNKLEVDQSYVLERLNSRYSARLLRKKPTGPYYLIDVLLPLERKFDGIFLEHDGYVIALSGV